MKEKGCAQRRVHIQYTLEHNNGVVTMNTEDEDFDANDQEREGEEMTKYVYVEIDFELIYDCTFTSGEGAHEKTTLQICRTISGEYLLTKLIHNAKAGSPIPVREIIAFPESLEKAKETLLEMVVGTNQKVH